MFKPNRVLLIITFLCAITLAFVYEITLPLIEKQQKSLLESSLKNILKAHSYKKELAQQPYYTACDEKGDIVGWCLPVSTRGYSGQIRLLVGVANDGKITGIEVLEHNETPGLGSKIKDIGYKQTEPEFLRQFKGKTAGELVFVKSRQMRGVQAISQATISSKAVTEGVKKSIEEFFLSKDKK